MTDPVRPARRRRNWLPAAIPGDPLLYGSPQEPPPSDVDLSSLLESARALRRMSGEDAVTFLAAVTGQNLGPEAAHR